jgi:hypothetical protein
MLLKALLQGETTELLLRLQKLWCASRVEWRGRIGRKESIRHHLKTGVNEARDLGNEGLHSPARAGETCRLGTNASAGKSRGRTEKTILLISD